MNQILSSIIVLGITGLSFSFLLAFLSKKLKVKDDPRVEKVLSLLPGLNCGACGFSGCYAFANAVVRECKIFSGCLPGGNETNEKISQVLGIVGCIYKDKRVVTCSCGAENEEKKASFTYSGPQTCRAAHLIGGNIDCSYGCLYLGDCIRVCPANALCLKNKKIYVDINKCIGCGNCVRTCPRKLFELVPLKENLDLYYVACNNNDKAIDVKKVCQRGCIACGICTRVPNSPYYLKDNLSRIDINKAEKQEPLDEARLKCPTKCIFSTSVKHPAITSS